MESLSRLRRHDAPATSLGIVLIVLVTNFLVHSHPGFGYDWVMHIAPSLLVTLL